MGSLCVLIQKTQFPKCVHRTTGLYGGSAPSNPTRAPAGGEETLTRSRPVNFCICTVLLRANSCPMNWAIFPAVFCSTSQNDRSFSPIYSICVILIFNFLFYFYFFSTSLYISMFFVLFCFVLFCFVLTSQSKVTRPLAMLGWRFERAVGSIFFSLVSDQPVCTVKAFGRVTTEILTQPRAGALSGSRRALVKTFKGKHVILLPYTLDLLMQNKVLWGPFPPPLEICPLKIPRFFWCFFFFFI